MRLGIQPKVGLLTLSILLTVLSAYGFFSIRRSESEFLADATVLQKALTFSSLETAAKALWEVDEELARRALIPIFETQACVAAAILSDDGEVFVGLKRDLSQAEPTRMEKLPPELAAQLSELPEGEGASPSLALIAGALPKRQIVSAAVHWTQAGKRKLIGRVFVEFSLDFIAERVAEQRKNVGFLVLGLLVATLVPLFAFLRMTILSPVLRLSQASIAMAAGRKVRLPEKRGQDEIALLEINFNSMAEKIESDLDRLQLLARAGQEVVRARQVQDVERIIAPFFKQAIGALSVRIYTCPTSQIERHFPASLPSQESLSRTHQEGERLCAQRKPAWSKGESGQRRLLIPCLDGDGELLAYVECELPQSSLGDEKAECIAVNLVIGVAAAYENILFAAEQKSRGVIEAELAASRAVQEALLPPLSPIHGFEFGAFYRAASQTGGDWYGVTWDPTEEVLYAFVGDVTGHGVPSALLTGVVCGGIYGLSDPANKILGSQPEEVLHRLIEVCNRLVLRTGSRSSRLMTMAFVAIDCRRGLLHHCTAAHLPPFLVSADGSTKQLLNLGARLGFKEPIEYTLKTTPFAKGDTLFIYTDGLLENRSAEGRSLSIKALKQTLSESALLSPQAMVDGVVRSAQEIWQGFPFDDDVSILAIRQDA